MPPMFVVLVLPQLLSYRCYPLKLKLIQKSLCKVWLKVRRAL